MSTKPYSAFETPLLLALTMWLGYFAWSLRLSENLLFSSLVLDVCIIVNLPLFFLVAGAQIKVFIMRSMQVLCQFQDSNYFFTVVSWKIPMIKITCISITQRSTMVGPLGQAIWKFLILKHFKNLHALGCWKKSCLLWIKGFSQNNINNHT